MNREEILQAATGLPIDQIEEAREYRYVQDYPEQREIWAVLGVDQRRVIVRDSRPVGPDIGASATTVPVTAFTHLYCVPEHRGEGHEEGLILAELEAAANHALTRYVAVFATEETAALWARCGFTHPNRSPEGFMVYALTDEPWPAGSVDTRGRW